MNASLTSQQQFVLLALLDEEREGHNSRTVASLVDRGLARHLTRPVNKLVVGDLALTEEGELLAAGIYDPRVRGRLSMPHGIASGFFTNPSTSHNLSIARNAIRVFLADVGFDIDQQLQAAWLLAIAALDEASRRADTISDQMELAELAVRVSEVIDLESAAGA